MTTPEFMTAPEAPSVETPERPDPPLRPAVFRPSKRDLAMPIVRFGREVCHFEPWPRQTELLSAIYRSLARVIILRLGRRSGKGTMAALCATFESTVNAAVHLAAVRPGERPVVAVIANSAAQSGMLQGMIRGFLRSPGLAELVVNDTREVIELSTGIDIIVLPASGRSARGRAICVAIWDEAAHAQDGTGELLSPQAAGELWTAVAPAVLQFPAGRIVVLSTPRHAAGLFHTLVQQAESGRFPDMIAMHAATQEVNPTIPASRLEAERDRDPILWSREFLARFDSGISALFDQALVHACVAPRDTLPPVSGFLYRIAIDPAYAHDAWAAMVGHLDREGRLVVDRCAAWRGTRKRPIDHRTVLDEVAVWSRAYYHAGVTTDQYAAHAIESGLEERGIRVDTIPWTSERKVEASQALRQRFATEMIELPDNRDLVSELVNLETRPSPTGRPRIAAPGNGSDDLASALLGLTLAFEQRPHVSYSTSYLPDDREPVTVHGDLRLVGARYADKEPR